MIKIVNIGDTVHLMVTYVPAVAVLLHHVLPEHPHPRSLGLEPAKTLKMESII
jgi:hypothetical protein